MKICKECGEELEEDCLVCPECLHEVVSMEDVIIKEQSQKDSKEEDKRTETSQVDNNSQNEKNANIYGLVGMIVGIVAFLIGWIMILAGIVLGVIGIVFSALGITKRQECTMNAFAIAGISVSIATVAFLILFWIITASNIGS